MTDGPFRFRLIHLFTAPFGRVGEDNDITQSLLHGDDTSHLIEYAETPVDVSRIMLAMWLLNEANKEKDVDFVISFTYLHEKPAFVLSLKRTNFGIIAAAVVNVKESNG